MLTRKSTGSRDTEITAFAVIPSVLSPCPVVTTVTPDGKRLIASRRASGPVSRVSQPYLFRSCSPSAGNSVSFVEVDESDRYATTRGVFRQGVLSRGAPRATSARRSPGPIRTSGQRLRPRDGRDRPRRGRGIQPRKAGQKRRESSRPHRRARRRRSVRIV